MDEAIQHAGQLAELDLWWVEEPTRPADILGHARIADALHSVRIATGEHCHNRIMIKQVLQTKAVEVLQIDGCRLGGYAFPHGRIWRDR